MFRNHLQMAWRHLLKGKMYSFINIAGLATGMAVTMLIALWVWDEMSFDHYHQHHRQLALVFDTQTWNGKANTDREVDIPLENELKTQYAQDIKQISLVSPGENSHLLTVNDKKIIATGMYVEPVFTDMMSLEMISGVRNGLSDPFSVLLTASLAKKLFGSSNPINQAIQLDSNTAIKVAGVYEDLPKNSSFNFVKFLLPWQMRINNNSWVRESSNRWGSHAGRLIVQLNEQTDINKLNAKIKDIPKKYIKEGREEVFLHPMDKWHLYNEFKNGKASGGRIQFVWLFSIIGAFVLLLACINFMNLSTARSQQRAKEVGIRKSIGSLRIQLVTQFLSESVMMSFLALLLAVLLVFLLLPFFNSLLSGKQLTMPWSSPAAWLVTTGFALFTGLLAGTYPAFYLSAFKPVRVLKGPFRTGRFASMPRKVLVTVQFTVSIILIIGTIIVYQQIQFAKERPVGYTREGLVSVNTMYTPQLVSHFDALRTDLVQTGTVEDIASSNGSATEVWNNQTGYNWEGKDPGSDPMFRIVAVTHNYGKTLGWTVISGRDFSKDFGTDTAAIILNEAAVKLTGFKNPLGEIIQWHEHRNRVIGVVKDMVMDSPYKPAEPTIFFLSYGWSSYMTIRVKPNLPMRQALSAIAGVFKKYNPERPFDYSFVDEDYADKFAAEERVGSLAAFFSTLAIFISCLGLFGLAAFVAEQRTKEIGIRKVLGASVFNLWGLLSKEFISLVILSFLIAAPIAAYYLNHWLKTYEYRTPIHWWVFALTAGVALLITLLTVSAQSIKAAVANPVKSLKAE